MAAKNANVVVPAGGTWVRLTDSAASVATITIDNVGTEDVVIQGTTGAAPTAGSTDGVKIPPYMKVVNFPLADLFPGVAATQVWAIAPAGDGEVFVSHGA